MLLPILGLRLRNKEEGCIMISIKSRKLVYYLLFLAYIFYLLYLVFFSKDYGRNIIHNDFNLIPFKSITQFISNPADFRVFWVNIIGNIAAFLPMGFFLPLVISRLNNIYRTTVLVLLISIIIEINQFIFKVGVFDLDDIILNTIGGLIGFCIYRLIKNIIKKR